MYKKLCGDVIITRPGGGARGLGVPGRRGARGRGPWCPGARGARGGPARSGGTRPLGGGAGAPREAVRPIAPR